MTKPAKKHERDEFHMKALTPIGIIGIRKKGEDEHPAMMSEGERPGSEQVHATPRPNEPILDLRPVYATNKGPAQVATDTYRKGHDRIFGKRRKYDIN